MTQPDPEEMFPLKKMPYRDDDGATTITLSIETYRAFYNYQCYLEGQIQAHREILSKDWGGGDA